MSGQFKKGAWVEPSHVSDDNSLKLELVQLLRDSILNIANDIDIIEHKLTILEQRIDAMQSKPSLIDKIFKRN